ncbi:MAG: hypothetical protein U0U67_15545 [Chitinophagales bacterium]
MIPVTNTIKKYAEHLVAVQFMDAGIKVFQNISAYNDTFDLIIKSKTGNYYDILVEVIDHKFRSELHIYKRKYNFELKDNYYIALAVFDQGKHDFYLIPFNVFKKSSRTFTNIEYNP